MKPAEVADAMGMAKRSYEHFEAGKGKINLERIHRFPYSPRYDVSPPGASASPLSRFLIDLRISVHRFAALTNGRLCAGAEPPAQPQYDEEVWRRSGQVCEADSGSYLEGRPIANEAPP